MRPKQIAIWIAIGAASMLLYDFIKARMSKAG